MQIRYFIPISNPNESPNMKRLDTIDVSEPLLPEDQGKQRFINCLHIFMNIFWIYLTFHRI